MEKYRALPRSKINELPARFVTAIASSTRIVRNELASTFLVTFGNQIEDDEWIELPGWEIVTVDYDELRIPSHPPQTGWVDGCTCRLCALNRTGTPDGDL